MLPGGKGFERMVGKVKGLRGKGFSGTTIKDTWTKPRGWVEARERGEFGWGGGEC